MYQVKQLSKEISALSPDDLEALAVLLTANYANIAELFMLELQDANKLLKG